MGFGMNALMTHLITNNSESNHILSKKGAAVKGISKDGR